MRKSAWAGLALSVVALSGILTAGAAAGAPVKVSVLDASQSLATSKGLKIRLETSQPSRVKISVVTSTFDGTSRGNGVDSVRTGGGSRTVIVGLPAGIRKASNQCLARTFTVIAEAGGRSARDSATMTRNTGPCRTSPVDLSKAEDCDFIAQPQNGICMLPFPNDFYTRADETSPTGRRIAFTEEGMPRNRDGEVVNPTDYNYSDGFSQGQGIIVRVPGVDSQDAVDANGFVQLDRLSRYALPDQRAVVINARTGERHPIWVQVDSNASSDADRALMISPSVNFDEKGHYIVALRNLVDAEGKSVRAPNAFRYYRDRIPSGERVIEQRRDHFEGLFRTLRDAGIKRSNLYLAWDFTVASNENNYSRALYMRDEAFAELGDTTMADEQVQGDSPAFDVTTVAAGGSSLRLPDGTTRNIPDDVARYVAGTYTVPCFLTGGAGSPCGPGGRMELDERGLPKRFGNYQANFECIVPSSVFGPNGQPGRPHIYGHGLLGASAEVVFSPVSRGLGSNYGMVGCATDEIGMAAPDIVSVILLLKELSGFPKLADRLQQGLLNELFLARLMFHPDGLGSDPAFQDGNGQTPGDSVIRTDDVYYTGASQGGIMGGALTAISPDFTRASLIVGAMNYSTLLTRSSNWDTYGRIMYPAYPNEAERPLLLNIIQMLWDRGEPNGYAHVMTDDPPPETPPHEVNLHVALGDHQVSNFASDVMARTIGAKTNVGAIDPRRWPDYEPLWNVPRIQANEFPYSGTNVIYWDSGPPRPNPLNPNQTIGTGVPPYANIAPNAVDPRWEDPHGAPRGGAAGPVAVMSAFLQPNGSITDTCNGLACIGGGWDGNFEALP